PTYIYRDLLVGPKVIPAQLSVLCWDDGSNIPRVVPAVIVQRNGSNYARAYSRSNSIYAVVAGSKTFTDMQQHAARNDVELLASKLILSGKNKQIFDPNGNVNRAEFASMLVSAMGLKMQRGQQMSFTDVHGNEWFASSIAAAVQAKIINGMPDGSFQPQRNVNRQEAMVMLANTLQMAGFKYEPGAKVNESLLAGFNDRRDIAGWACPAVAFAVKAGMIKREGSFAAQHKLSRAEAACLVAALLRAGSFIDDRSSVLTAVAKKPETETDENNPPSRNDGPGILVVEGTALAHSMNYSLQDLKAMTDIIVRDSYYSRGKAKEGWSAAQHDTFTGVSLYKLLLDKIGLKSVPAVIEVVADDGYTKMFTLDEATGLYMDETDPDAASEVIIAWSRNGVEFSDQTQPFRIVCGQKYEGDFNRQNWVNYVKKITVD
ncbi:MAG: S-layer homology domain-containing protein, partial [Methanobacterium sp.]